MSTNTKLNLSAEAVEAAEAAAREAGRSLGSSLDWAAEGLVEAAEHLGAAAHDYGEAEALAETDYLRVMEALADVLLASAWDATNRRPTWAEEDAREALADAMVKLATHGQDRDLGRALARRGVEVTR